MRSPVGMFIGSGFCVIGAMLMIYLGEFRPLFGAIVVAIGMFANVAVMIANNGKFPIQVFNQDEKSKIVADDSYIPMSNQTKLNWLGDRFRIFETYSYSIGDVLMLIGVILMILISLAL